MRYWRWRRSWSKNEIRPTNLHRRITYHMKKFWHLVAKHHTSIACFPRQCELLRSEAVCQTRNMGSKLDHLVDDSRICWWLLLATFDASISRLSWRNKLECTSSSAPPREVANLRMAGARPIWITDVALHMLKWHANMERLSTHVRRKHQQQKTPHYCCVYAEQNFLHSPTHTTT